jgi:hypothetical protein
MLSMAQISRVWRAFPKMLPLLRRHPRLRQLALQEGQVKQL